MTAPLKPENCEIILGNSNKRFSGVTSTMLQTLKIQKSLAPVCVLGKAHLSEEDRDLGLGFVELIKLCRQPLDKGRYRVFHARRNDEMIQALILKHIFRIRLRILFTSTAQRYHSRFSRWLMSKMDCVISTCAAAAAYLEHKPTQLIPHGIDSDTYHPSKDRSKEHIQVAMFGRVRAQKGSDIFIKACIDVLPQYPNAKALIVGAISPENKSFADQLKQQVADAGLSEQIQFTGELNFDEIPKLFRQSHIVAALSTTEGFGLTILEAMSSGAAVLATEAGAWPEIIEQGKQGWVVPVGDQEQVNAKLKLLLNDSEQLEKMGQLGRERILKRYKIEQEAEKLISLYRSLQLAN
ncbi:glycosyltransferase family 4 protein [Agaribacterium sp. ZY112]|uniref:glycosyltransferase family 4 protein n=1 Tax=Agaribacterium sp. ZY112 TaxID=3233574 RepID=UPI003525E610